MICKTWSPDLRATTRPGWSCKAWAFQSDLSKRNDAPDGLRHPLYRKGDVLEARGLVFAVQAWYYLGSGSICVSLVVAAVVVAPRTSIRGIPLL